MLVSISGPHEAECWGHQGPGDRHDDQRGHGGAGAGPRSGQQQQGRPGAGLGHLPPVRWPGALRHCVVSLGSQVTKDICKRGRVSKNSAKEEKATRKSFKVPKVLKGWTVKTDDDGGYIERPNACRYCNVSSICQDCNVPNVCEDCRVDNRCEVCKKIAEEEKIKFNVK